MSKNISSGISEISSFSGSSSFSDSYNCSQEFSKVYHLFFINSTDNERVKSINSCQINVDYLMPSAFEAIDNLNQYLQKRSASVKLKKSWLDVNYLDSVVDESCLRNSGILSPELIEKDEEIFVISSFSTNVFERLQTLDKKILSPLAIESWNQMMLNWNNFDLNEHLQKVTSYGLFSECMHNNVVYLSKDLSNDSLLWLNDRIRQMGGNVSLDMNIRVTHAVANTQVFNRCLDTTIMAAYFFQIPTVTIDWVNTSWTQLQFQYKFAYEKNFVQKKLCVDNFTDIVVKPLFKNFVIGIVPSVVSKFKFQIKKFNFYQSQYANIKNVDITIDRILEVVVRFGGTFVKNSSSLNYSKINIILHIFDDYDIADSSGQRLSETMNSRYLCDKEYMNLVQMKNFSIPILKMNWLYDSVAKQNVQPIATYKIDLINCPHMKNTRMGTSSLAEEISWIEESPTNIDLNEIDISQRVFASGMTVDGDLRESGHLEPSLASRRPKDPNSDDAYYDNIRQSWFDKNYSTIKYLNEMRDLKK